MTLIGDALIYATTLFGLFTSMFFLLTLLENKQRLYSAKLKKYPTVAIVVPAFNEETTILKTVKSLLSLQYPKNKIEIIVVDDGSTDRTFKVAKGIKDSRLRVYRKQNGGKFTALNYGLSKTRAEFVGALDADSFVDSRALKRIITYFYNDRVMAVTPSMKVYKPKTFLQRIQFVEYTVGIFLRKVFGFLGSIHVTPGPFSIYRREFFEKYGYYKKAHHTEDIEVALRIQKNDFIIENALDAYVYTMGLDKYKPLHRQRIRWYHGFISNVIDYRCLFGKKHGNLGLFILPGAFFSVFLVIAAAFYAIYLMVHDTLIWFKNFAAVNYSLSQMFRPNFDTFFLNTEAASLFAALTFIVGIFIIILSRNLAKEDNPLTASYILYIFVYWAFFAYWWIVAFSSKMLRKKVKWGHKTGQL